MQMRISKLKLFVLVVMSLFGLGAATEVLITFYFLNQALPGCQPGGFFDCAKVLSSSYGMIFGIPLEMFAVVYFIVNLVLVYFVSFGSQGLFRRALSVLFVWRFLGLMLVPYLVVIELFILHAVCIYCTMMHIAIVADFIIISFLLFFGKHALWNSEDGLDAPPGLN
jgi:uncharacterized membrane protein